MNIKILKEHLQKRLVFSKTLCDTSAVLLKINPLEMTLKRLVAETQVLAENLLMVASNNSRAYSRPILR